MAAIQPNQTGNQILAVLPQLLTAVKGQTSTETSQSNITQQGAQRIIDQILSSNTGLAAAVAGQRGAGLYNSTTNQQLINDLLARTSGEVAKLQAGNTTTRRTQPQVNPITTLLSAGGGVLGAKVLGPSIKAGMNKLGIPDLDTLGVKISDAIFGAGSTSASPATVAAADQAGGLIPAYGSSAAYDAAIGVGAGAGIGSPISAVTAEELASSVGLTQAGIDATLPSIGAVGGAAGLGMSAAEADAALLAFDTAVAAEGAGFLETAATAAAVWVICTELKSAGKLSPELYSIGSKHISSLSEDTINGYHYWAIPYTRLMRSSKWYGKLAVKFITPWAVGRTEYLAGNWNLLGWLTVVVGEPVCSLIGKLVGKQNWRTLYGQH